MKVTILGSGGPADPERMATGFLLETAQSSWLVDIGGGTLARLVEGLKFPFATHLDGAFISHPHADHITDLMWLVQSMLNINQLAGYPSYPEEERTKPLYLVGYPRLKENYESLRDIMVPERTEAYPVQVSEHGNERFQILDLTVTTKIVPHTQYFTSIGFRFESGGKVLMYTGDSGDCPALVELAQDADVALMEASMDPIRHRQRGPVPNHLSAFEDGRIAGEARVKHLVLTHLYRMSPDLDFEKEARKNFTGKITVAQDLLEITI